MKPSLKESGYFLSERDSVWHRSDYQSIKYSDGYEVEQRLASIVNNATDLTVLSGELKKHCTDWPSEYHLSGTRANLLRPFEEKLRNAAVLEIGAGCGAITRYLGESGASVLALEGTFQRASIARSRTRDLTNVEVVADNFCDFNTKLKFDVVTFIGVLEYANLFVPGENPTKFMLEKALSFLKPRGSLIVAIENQLGLKYFAGAKEDHLSLSMYGIEGRYRRDQPQTFGRAQLEKLLVDSGFRELSFFAPFPDYKLPVSIISELGFKSEAFDASALACQSVSKDLQKPELEAFCQELAWPVVAKNNLGMDLANSFLVVASPSQSDLTAHNTLAWHYSTSRRRDYCKQTRFSIAKAGVLVESMAFGALEGGSADNLLTHQVKSPTHYAFGTSLSHELLQALSVEGAGIAEVTAFFNIYLAALRHLTKDSVTDEALRIDTQIPGNFFDCIPQNIIRGKDDFTYIDDEWFANFPLEVGYLIFRALLALVRQRPNFTTPTERGFSSRKQFMTQIFEALGWELSEAAWLKYLQLELSVQFEVTGVDTNLEQFRTDLENSPFVLSARHADSEAMLPENVAGPNRMVTGLREHHSQLNQTILEREEEIARLDDMVTAATRQLSHFVQTVAERDEEIARLNHAVVDRDAKLASIHASNSWRLTRPLRELNRFSRRSFGFLFRAPRLGSIKHDSLESSTTKFTPKSYDLESSPISARHPVVVIVPVYRDVAFTRDCIESAMPGIIALPFARLVAINDNSPEEGMVDMLESLQSRWSEQMEVLHNEQNLGFVGTVNRGFSTYNNHDIVLLNSDVLVPQDWLSRLRAEAYSLGKAGTVTPFSNNATICSFPYFLKENDAPYGLDVNAVDAVFRHERLNCVEAPTGVGFCMYIRRDCLDDVGLLDQESFGRGYGEENDFCQRAIKRGWINLLTPNLYAYHKGGMSFSVEKQALVENALKKLQQLHPRYHEEVGRFITDDPLKKKRALRHLMLMNVVERPCVLFVAHNLGGGVHQHLEELQEYFQNRISILLLKPLDDGFLLRIGFEDNADELVFKKEQFQELLQLLRTAAVDCVHFHHTKGFSFDILKLGKLLNCNHIITVHDFYWLAGNPTLTNEHGVFEDNYDDLVNPLFPLPQGVSAEVWRHIHREFLESSQQIIFPSHSALELYEKHFEVTTAATVAPHLEYLRNVSCAPRAWPQHRIVTIGILGAIGKEKGADLLERIAVLCHRLGKPYRFVLLGYSYRPLSFVESTGKYDRNETSKLIEAKHLDLIFFPAQWPETYSYTLSYALESGLPIIAPAIGAFPERLHGREKTLLYQFGIDDARLIQSFDEFVKSLKSSLSQSRSESEPSIANPFYDKKYFELVEGSSPSERGNNCFESAGVKIPRTASV